VSNDKNNRIENNGADDILLLGDYERLLCGL